MNIKNSPTHKLGEVVQLELKLTQHSIDVELMKNFIKYFKCGYLVKVNRNAVYFIVTKIDYIQNKIISFFKKHPIHGLKALYFADWCKVVELMKEKKTSDERRLREIRNIKAEMNKGRKIKAAMIKKNKGRK